LLDLRDFVAAPACGPAASMAEQMAVAVSSLEMRILVIMLPTHPLALSVDGV
jgi:hypothetical protein